jgi:glycosyltransferase involved in cell wall biosynthesis
MNKASITKVYINARFLTHSVSGVQRYAIELLKALDKSIKSKDIDLGKISVTLLSPKNIKFELKLENISLKLVGSFSGHLWEQIELPFYALDGILVNLCNTGPLISKSQVLTIHDMAEFSIPANFSFQFRTGYQLLHKLLSKRVKRIISVSLFSKNEILKYCHIEPSKISVIYESGDHMSDLEADDSIIQKYNLLEKPFILAVSTINPNKNFSSILKAAEFLKDMDYNFVIAGRKSDIFNQSDNQSLSKAIYVGFVTDSELKALYNHAACFIFPSFYEGFGLPPLEAMSCGCPVIVSETTALPEICGNSALYCNPYSPEDIGIKLRELLSSKSLQNSLRQSGLECAKQYSWKTCAKETYKVITELVETA